MSVDLEPLIATYLIVDPPLNERKSSGYTRRQLSVSYGSFFPQFSVDTDSLKEYLDALKTKTSNAPVEPFYSESDAEPEEAEQKHRQKKHCHKDSLIESSIFLEGGSFLLECQRQLHLLYDFIKENLARMEDDLEHYLTKKEANSTKRKHCSVNMDPEEEKLLEEESINEFDAASIGGDSGILDDQLATPQGLLNRIYNSVLNLQSILNSALEQLDKMVGIYDDHMLTGDGRLLLAEHRPKSEELHTQLQTCLLRINNELEDLSSNARNNEQRKKEMSYLAMAKNQRFEPLNILALLLLVVASASVLYLASSRSLSRWLVVLRLFRSPVIIVMYLYLYGLNMLVWAKKDINYIKIFEYPENGIPTPRRIFRIASLFSILYVLLIAVCFLSEEFALYIVDKVVTMTMWLILLLFLFNPLNIFMKKGRFAFMFVVLRILIAPIPVVTFGDFWFADQLNSMVALLLDVQYLICYLTTASWYGHLDLKACTSSSNGVRPILSCLPSLWRFFQCLRCYQRTRKVAHIVNAIKYFTTFPVVIFAMLFSMKVKFAQNLHQLDMSEVGWIIILWCISSIIHALYTFVWDVVMDWGLFSLRLGMLLRPTLYYRRWVYYVAILFDFVIRFACAVKLTLAIVYHLDSDMIYTSLIVAEVLRRVVWNFFRVEYEEIKLSQSKPSTCRC